MKFVINRDYNYSRTRAIILQREENGYIHTMFYRPSVVIQTTCDWDNNDVFPIVGDTDSIQYRPKSIYVNTKGEYYYKDCNKKVKYLDESDTADLIRWMNAAKLYLETN